MMHLIELHCKIKVLDASEQAFVVSLTPPRSLLLQLKIGLIDLLFTINAWGKETSVSSTS